MPATAGVSIAAGTALESSKVLRHVLRLVRRHGDALFEGLDVVTEGAGAARKLIVRVGGITKEYSGEALRRLLEYGQKLHPNTEIDPARLVRALHLAVADLSRRQASTLNSNGIDLSGFGNDIRRYLKDNELGDAPNTNPTRGAVTDANFAQKRPSSGQKAFSKEGQRIYSEAAKRPIETINDLASALRSGDVSPSQVPIDYVIVDGKAVIHNTRSSDALRRAGIPQSQWYGRNRTGQVAYTDPNTKMPVTYDDLVRNQTRNNGYGPTGTPNP